MRAYAQNMPPDKAARDRLIAEHVGMARRIALRVGRGTPSGMSEDLVSAGMMGLVEAANRYDFSREEPFPAFAHRRIRGAVLDAMRRDDIVPRRVRSLAKKAGRMMQAFEQERGRAPEDEEVAECLGVTSQAYRDALRAVTQSSFVVLTDHEVAASDSVPTRRSWDPSASLAKRDLSRRLRAGLEAIPERDARILSLYYLEELTYAEIGSVLGVSEARICQLHGRAVLRLRAAMEKEEDK